MAKKITVITGATCSRKSRFAVSLAKKKNGVIINADLMQMYSDLKILTAYPTFSEMEGVTHAIFGVLDFNEKIDILDWLKMVESAIQNFDCENFIIVGGTTMYISAIINGFVNIPKIESELQKKISDYFLADPTNFYKYAISADNLIENRINQNHKSRIIRAVAVKIQTGKSIFDWQKSERVKPTFQIEKFFIMKKKREDLYKSINARIDEMLNLGALEEIENFNKKKGENNSQLQNALGYREFNDFLEGKSTILAAKEKAKQVSRNYAKRQITWNKHQYKKYTEIEINF